jgi:5-methylcytosine-specific restriction endonuclease McrA
MSYRSRKYMITIPASIPPDASELYDSINNAYSLRYLGVYTNVGRLLVYLQFSNRIELANTQKLLDKLGVDVESVSKCTKFSGEDILSEKGERPDPGGHLKRKRKPTKKTYVAEATPFTPIANCKIVQNNIYKDVASGDSGPDSFHAVWSSKGGLWYPMMWVGPLRNIQGRGIEKRSSLKPWMVDELFERQNHECRLCQTKVFTGTFSNSDVDHIVPLKHGGSSNSLSNLQVLCVTCHRRKTALECKKIVATMGDPDVDWDPSKIYLTNTHVHHVPGIVECSGSLDALVHLEEEHGVFEMA